MSGLRNPDSASEKLASTTSTFMSRTSRTVPVSSWLSTTVYSKSPPPTSLLRRGLTDGSCFALSNRFHYADDTAGLQGGLKPVGGVLHIGHVDAQAAILTQQDHRCPLLLIAGRVPDGNHVLDLGGGDRGVVVPAPIDQNLQKQAEKQLDSWSTEGVLRLPKKRCVRENSSIGLR